MSRGSGPVAILPVPSNGFIEKATRRATLDGVAKTAGSATFASTAIAGIFFLKAVSGLISAASALSSQLIRDKTGQTALYNVYAAFVEGLQLFIGRAQKSLLGVAAYVPNAVVAFTHKELMEYLSAGGFSSSAAADSNDPEHKAAAASLEEYGKLCDEQLKIAEREFQERLERANENLPKKKTREEFLAEVTKWIEEGEKLVNNLKNPAPASSPATDPIKQIEDWLNTGNGNLEIMFGESLMQQMLGNDETLQEQVLEGMFDNGNLKSEFKDATTGQPDTAKVTDFFERLLGQYLGFPSPTPRHPSGAALPHSQGPASPGNNSKGGSTPP